MAEKTVTNTNTFIPKDPLNEGEKTQFVQFISKQHPEGSVRGYCPRGKSVELPNYVNELCIKHSYVHEGHVVFQYPKNPI